MRALRIQQAALGALGLSFLLGMWVDPMVGNTPWWSYPEQLRLWVALGPPLALWLLLALIGIVVAARAGAYSFSARLMVAAWVLSTSLIAWLPWHLHLRNVFPSAGRSAISVWLGLAGIGLGLIVGVSRVTRRRKTP